MSDRFVADKLIEEYLAAYRRANGKEPDFKLRYVNGFVTFNYGGARTEKRRLPRLVEMTSNLAKRAS